MTTYEQVARRWRDRALGIDNRRALRHPRMIDDGDLIYSYGHHFELARPLRDKNGDAVAFLLNGDRYSNTTTSHQAVIRNILSSHETVTIPHQALRSSGIDLDSIRIVEVTSDRYTYEHFSSTNREDAPERVTIYPADALPSYFSVDADGFPQEMWFATFDGQIYRWTTSRHWLGESLISAEVPFTIRCRRAKEGHHTLPRPEFGPSPDHRAFPDDGKEWDAAYQVWATDRAEKRRIWEASYVPSTCSLHGQNSWGEAACDGIIRKRRRALFLSGFDRNEARASYFFCELPATSRATTVEEAYADLKPDTVKFAEALGREVKRQGDIFAIPVPAVTRRALTKAGAVFTKRGNVFQTDHRATELAVLPDGTTLARGCLRHQPQWRRPDHHRVSLGKDFHVLVKNTVPLAA